MAALLLPGGGEVLFGRAEDPDDVVWHGPHPLLSDHAEAAGFEVFETTDRIRPRLLESGSKVHYLPPYRDERRMKLSSLLDIDPRQADAGVSAALVRAVVNQRNVKSDAEVAELEDAIGVTDEMYRAAAAAMRPGRTEYEIAAVLRKVAFSKYREFSFNPIVTVHGEVLHNMTYENTLAAGDLVVMDGGAESPLFYAADITRTFPVSGRFTPEQRAVYEVVLATQLVAIEKAAPGNSNREVHLTAARTIVGGLVEMGLMKGDPDDAVAEGAHALFFPHGIGHMLGLDVHDMEDLGDEVGYPGGEPRSTRFGLNLLRLVRELEPGFVITIEPGIYFIPALIGRWRDQGLHTDFIRYDRLEGFMDFGGIRIEDDIVITETGSRVLGPGIPKTIDDVEAAVGG
jgi:Xaa-Pro aminopeptidase